MLWTGEQLKAHGVIENSVPEGFKSASYDLHLDTIIVPFREADAGLGGTKSAASHPDMPVEVKQYFLPPQGVARVVSKEIVRLDRNLRLAGYAMVKTTLCNQGVLAINIGIVDPGFSGPISTLLINFGKVPYLLQEGQEFLRLTFHEHTALIGLPMGKAWSREDYVREQKAGVAGRIAETFLDVASIGRRFSADFRKEAWRVALTVVPVAALIIAMMAILVALGSAVISRYTLPSPSEIRALETRVQSLEADLARRAPPTPTATPSPAPLARSKQE